MQLLRRNLPRRFLLKADYYADPIPSSDFGLVAKINISRAKSKQSSCAEMVLGSFVSFFGRVIQQLGFGTQKNQANVDYCCYVRRRAECNPLGPGL